MSFTMAPAAGRASGTVAPFSVTIDIGVILEETVFENRLEGNLSHDRKTSGRCRRKCSRIDTVSKGEAYLATTV
jgi:hypothetical protein